MVKTAELICGVCGDLFRNPHRLPCGHSFCRRPCLLPTPSSTRASCIHCNTQFHVSELERNCELDESVQKRRNQESQRVACYLCRSLHDRCSVCAHCHQRLCDLCLKEHVNEDIQKLCEVREITELAADTLEDFKSSRPATDLEREDYTLTARLDTIVAQLRRLHRLVDQRLSTATRIKQDVGTSKQTAKSTTMPIQIQQEEKEKQGKKHQRGLQKHLDISRSRNAVEIFVDGVRAKITALDLKTQFETFGEVLDVFVPRKHRGFGYIALLPTGDPSEILWNKMIIHGVKINVRKCYSFDDGKKELVKLKEETKLKIFDKSAKFLKLSVDGIRRQISAEDVRAHFANFGEVLDVKMFMNPVTNEQSGNCHIMLRPTSDCNQILLAEHLIRGVRINIVEVHACNELDISLVRFAEVNNKKSVFSQPLISKLQLSPAKLELPIQPEPIEQQKQPEQSPLKLFVDGVKKELSPQDLEAHFSRFGKVLDITMFMNPTIMEHNGNGNITLRPTTDRSQILETEHTIRGIRINVRIA